VLAGELIRNGVSAGGGPAQQFPCVFSRLSILAPRQVRPRANG
jgi:hypothetical protein